MVRNHDNILRNLRQEMNQTKEKSDAHDKNLQQLSKDQDNYKQSNNDNIDKSKFKGFCNMVV